MLLLLTSYVCDHCERPADPASYEYVGFVVVEPERLGSGRALFVFRSRTDAALWRSKRGIVNCEIREVWSEHPFVWQPSRGSFKDVTLADRPFEIYPDHRYEPAPNRAFLAPLDAVKAA